MAKHRPGKSNQRLYFAKIHLENLNELNSKENILHRKALYQAHKEAFLFQLYGAFEGLLWEIANTYDVTMQAGMGAEGLQRVCQQQERVCPEVDRLLDLSQREGHWLQAFLRDWRKAQTLDPHEFGTLVAPANLNSIEIRRVDDEENTDQLNQWHREMGELINETRTILGEW